MSEALNRVRTACEQQGLRFSEDRGDSFRVQCPGHDGTNCNLAVWVNDDGWIGFKCWSKGCRREQILASLGLGVADIGPGEPHSNSRDGVSGSGIGTWNGALTPLDRLKELLVKSARSHAEWEYPPTEPPHKNMPFEVDGYKHEASYLYRDVDGTPLYAKEKWRNETDPTDKQMRHSVWDRHSGSWKIGSKPADAPRVFYNADLLRKARTSKLPVILVEGEKDADRLSAYLEQFGFKAAVVSFPDGANHRYPPALYADLTGVQLVIIGDNDEPGQKFVKTVSDTLTGTFKTSHPLVFMPTGGKDISDHFDNEYDLGQLAPFTVSDDTDTATEAQSNSKIGVEEAGIGTWNGEPLRLPFTNTWSAQIPMKATEWLWQSSTVNSYIPANQLCVVTGREGSGKSLFTLWLASNLTRGTLPGKYWGLPQNVSYVAVEDSWESVITSRVAASGADMNRVGRLGNAESITGRFLLPNDNDRLQRYIETFGIKLMVMDPFVSLLATDKQNDQTAIRKAVEPLYSICENTDCVIVCVMHVNKKAEGDISSRINGSGAFKDTARSILAFGYNKDTGEAVMTSEKSSYGLGVPASLEYQVTTADVTSATGETFPAQRFTFGQPTERTAREVLDEYITGEGRKEARLDSAAAWLNEYLSEHGATTSADIRQAAETAGIKKSTLYSAKDELQAAGKLDDTLPRGYWGLIPSSNSNPTHPIFGTEN